MAGALNEIRHAIRVLVRTPGVTVVAALSLALGIGANSAVFSLHDAILWRPLPVRDAGSIVTVTTERVDERSFGGRVSYLNYQDIRAASGSFDGFVAYQFSTVGFGRSRESTPEIRMASLVSDNYFEVLGVVPAVGRSFAAGEGRASGRDPLVILGYDFWKNTLGQDPSIVGRMVLVNGVELTVIGILPASFTGLDPFVFPSLYVPASMAQRLNAGPDPARSFAADPLENRAAHDFIVKARLKPSVSQPAAAAEMQTIWAGLVARYPDANRHRSVAVRSEVQQRVSAEPGNAIMVSMMTALGIVVLVISCANVANMLLGRAQARSREMAIRLALGVGRYRLLRQLLTESLLLALVGCALGLGVAYVGIQFLSAMLQNLQPTDIPLLPDPHLDWRVVMVSLIAAAVSAIIFGLAPAWQSLRTQLVTILKDSPSGNVSRARTIGRSILVSGQVALSMVLLVIAGMLMSGYRTSLDLSPGFRTDGLLMASLDTALMRYPPPRTHDFYRQLGERVRALPGVASATLTSAIPFDSVSLDNVVPEGYRFPPGQESAAIDSAIVDERFFDTLNIRIVSGRAFAANDTETSPRVAIVNEAFAATYWPDQDPIGKRVAVIDPERTWLEIVGVARSVKHVRITQAPRPFLYRPFAQNERPQMSLLIHAAGADPMSLAMPVRESVRTLDPNLPLFNLRTYASFFEQRAIGPQLLVMQVVSTMGMFGLSLALIGLYGLVAYWVERRTREMGIRMAMGAGQVDVLKMVLRQGLMLSMTGIVVGGVVSAGLTRLLSATLAGVALPNVATYILVPLALIVLTIAASYFPARHAAAIDPLRAIRHD